ncbi:hypothetical protein AB1Y20_022547 [Prymnesium parvum]|uniref:Fe2OG dioxygenase domain-containing protein n=1 Tax=Prymnesium parvum TaxID=97485 RepID=A0AB34JJA8_PRYPA
MCRESCARSGRGSLGRRLVGLGGVGWSFVCGLDLCGKLGRGGQKAVHAVAVRATITPLLAPPLTQVLRYETSQFYKTHHDQNSPRASAWGPRMFTVFMYVGDGYTGGETHFPRLNLTVAAKKGSACVWTSVLDSDPFQRDDRTDHESLPVKSGVKYGVNYWVHMYPFRAKSMRGCGNQAYIENWY